MSREAEMMQTKTVESVRVLESQVFKSSKTELCFGARERVACTSHASLQPDTPPPFEPLPEPCTELWTMNIWPWTIEIWP